MQSRKFSLGFVAVALALAIFGTPTQATAQTSPLIVATGKFVGQTKGIANTTLYTPSETGLFRVSVYMCMTKPGSANRVWMFVLNWTDDAGTESDQLADVAMN